jgi:nucleotide-binding universal stress UspA family protein
MGRVAAWVVSLVIAGLLLSAVNTAIVDLIAIQFLMSRDKELPSAFQRLNRFGVPVAGMMVATVIPVLLVLLEKDMAGLADLYAIGVVGAIAANLGSTSTDRRLGLRWWERGFMFGTFLVMAAIEVSLFVDKPHARVFAVTILALGLVLRGLATEHAAKSRKTVTPAAVAATTSGAERRIAGESRDPILCAVRGVGRTLDFALEEAQEAGRRLYVLFVREQAVITPEDRDRKWPEDPQACKIFSYAEGKAGSGTVIPCYSVSDSAADTIVDLAATLGVGRLILGAPQRSSLLNLLRGNIIRQVSGLLPENIHLLVCA